MHAYIQDECLHANVRGCIQNRNEYTHPYPTHTTHKSVWINKSLVTPTSTSNQSSKPCTVLQYPSRKICVNTYAIGMNTHMNTPHTDTHVYTYTYTLTHSHWHIHTESMDLMRTQIHTYICVNAYTRRVIHSYMNIPHTCIYIHTKSMYLIPIQIHTHL